MTRNNERERQMTNNTQDVIHDRSLPEKPKSESDVVWLYKAILLSEKGVPLHIIEEEMVYHNRYGYKTVFGYAYARAAKHLNPTWSQSVCVVHLVRKY